MLARVPDDVDKREGSIIYTTLAPIAAQLAEQRIVDDTVRDTVLPDTAEGNDLTRVCGIFRVNRYPASKAVRKAILLDVADAAMYIPIGSRFGAENVFYTVTQKLSATEYALECQQAGTIGNRYFGPILPIDNIGGLGTATMIDVLVAGEDEETDDALRTRFYKTVNTQRGVGTVAQYEEAIRAIEGVGDVKVFPTPDDQGGIVQCIIVAPGNLPASEVLVQRVQDIIDPGALGKGDGLAMIGHHVTISTVEQVAIAVSSTVALLSGHTLESVTLGIEESIGAYFASIAFSEDIVRVARVDAAILSVTGIADVSGTTLNGQSENLTLQAVWNCYEVPSLGQVTLQEGI